MIILILSANEAIAVAIFPHARASHSLVNFLCLANPQGVYYYLSMLLILIFISCTMYQDIMSIVYAWVQDDTAKKCADTLGICYQTVLDWYSRCREIATIKFEGRAKMGGAGCTIQIDESLLHGKRKNNRGRLLVGNRRVTEDPTVLRTMVLPTPDNRRNYGSRVNGPWIFGLTQKFTDGNVECRYFYVEKRDRQTLQAILLREVHPESTIHSDEWAAYDDLAAHFHQHQTVNHQHYFVDPITGANTQRVEKYWAVLKRRMLRERNNVKLHRLDQYLIEQWYRISTEKPILQSFLTDIAMYQHRLE